MNEFSFRKKPHIIVDATSEFIISPVCVRSSPKPLLTKSLINAIKCAEPGWTIQIRRGSYFHYGLMCENGVDIPLRIVGESEEECAARLGLEKPDSMDIPERPFIYISDNCAFVSSAPLFLENLMIESGHACPFCDPSDMDPFPAIYTESLLMLKDCCITSFQGNSVTAVGETSGVIAKDCTFNAPDHCIYLHGDASLVAEETHGNIFNICLDYAIGTQDPNAAGTLVHELKETNYFDHRATWPNRILGGYTSD